MRVKGANKEDEKSRRLRVLVLGFQTHAELSAAPASSSWNRKIMDGKVAIKFFPHAEVVYAYFMALTEEHRSDPRWRCWRWSQSAWLISRHSQKRSSMWATRNFRQSKWKQNTRELQILPLVSFNGCRFLFLQKLWVTAHVLLPLKIPLLSLHRTQELFQEVERPIHLRLELSSNEAGLFFVKHEGFGSTKCLSKLHNKRCFMQHCNILSLIFLTRVSWPNGPIENAKNARKCGRETFRQVIKTGSYSLFWGISSSSRLVCYYVLHALPEGEEKKGVLNCAPEEMLLPRRYALSGQKFSGKCATDWPGDPGKSIWHTSVWFHRPVCTTVKRFPKFCLLLRMTLSIKVKM